MNTEQKGLNGDELQTGSLPGIGRVIGWGLMLMLGGLLVLAYFQFIAPPPPRVTPLMDRFAESTIHAKETLKLGTLVVTGATGFTILGFIVAVVGVIIRVASRGHFPRDGRPNVLVRVVVPGCLAMVIVLFLGQVGALKVSFYFAAQARATAAKNAAIRRDAEAKAQERRAAQEREKGLARIHTCIMDLQSPNAKTRAAALDSLSLNPYLEECPPNDKKQLSEIIQSSAGLLVRDSNDFGRIGRVLVRIDKAGAAAMEQKFREHPANYFPKGNADLTNGAGLAAMTRNASALARSLDDHVDPLGVSTISHESIFETGVKGGSVEILKVLLEHGAPPDSALSGGGTALALYCSGNFGSRANLLKLLMQFHADPNKRDKDGNPSLRNVVKWHDAASAQVLLENGAEVNALDKDGCTAYDFCSTLTGAQRRQLESLLEKYNGKPGIQAAPGGASASGAGK